MDKREYLINLFEVYEELLTSKQKLYFKSYYFEDLSLNEIGEINNVSKSFVSKIINNIEKKIINYENILKINEKNELIKKLIDETNGKIKSQLEEILDK